MPRRSASIRPTGTRPRTTRSSPSRSRILGALAYQKNLPSFNCATAKRQVEKAICADPGLAQLDRNINDVFLRVIADAESDSHRAALALTQEQRNFVAERNASFGRRGYDLRQAMEERLDKLNTIARQ